MLLFLLGLVFPSCYAWLILATISAADPATGVAFMTIVGLFVGAFIALLIVVGTRFRTKAFIAGAIVGILLAPLVVFSLCCIALAGSLRH